MRQRPPGLNLVKFESEVPLLWIESCLGAQNRNVRKPRGCARINSVRLYAEVSGKFSHLHPV
ncbi:Uncharacterised protein [Mobiluncus holmesii]|nr:Uncharacterised protein [Mobiluncus holmesii]